MIAKSQELAIDKLRAEGDTWHGERTVKKHSRKIGVITGHVMEVFGN
jgi:hypothetical protein